MANKTFKARFKQLIAPLTAWQSGGAKADFKILPGEIAFATASITDVKGGEAPVVLVKVNNTADEATWDNLEYSVYAKAQDVYAWAKKSGVTVVESGEGAGIASIAWDTTDENSNKIVVTHRKLTTADIDGLDNLIAGLDDKYVAQETGKSLMTEAEHTKLAGIAEGATKVENVGDGKIKINGVEATVYEHPLTHKTTDISDFEAGVHTVVDNDIAAAKKAGDDAQADVDTLSQLVGDLPEGATATTVVGYVDEKTANIASDSRVKDVEDRVKAIEDAPYTNKQYVDDQDAATLEAAKAYTDDMKDAILGEGIKDTFDTLVEIQSWIEGDGVNATELTEAIAEEARLRGEADTALDGRLDVIEAKPAMGIGAGDIVNWNKEIGALELAQTKLDASVYNTYVEGHSYKDATIDTMVQGAKDYADGLVGSDIQTLSVTGGESNAAVVRLSKNGGFFTLQGDDTTHITVDPIDEMSIIQIKHNTHEVVAPAPVEVGVDKYGHVAIGNNLQFTDSYAVDNPIATKTYVDTKTHNIEDLTQVDYVIFDANI